MADRRMFSKRIINSGRFLKMPISSQALYFHLGLNADDDGIVEAYNVISSINGCTEDDLKVLVSKGFIQVLNDDLVTYITDWTENNKIRADRKIDSIYKDLLISINPSVKLIEKRQRADTKPKVVEMDNQWTSNGQPMDGIGKDRLGKDSKNKNVSSAKRNELISLFEDLYKRYHKLHPSSNGKSKARDKYILWCTKGVKGVKLTPEQIEDAVSGYVQEHIDKEDKGEWTPPYKNIDTLMNNITDYIKGDEDDNG